MKHIACFLLIIFIYYGCNTNQNDFTSDFRTLIIDKAESFIEHDDQTDLVFPAFIRTASDHFLVYDGRQNLIFQFNYTGEQFRYFGREGRGPGEFQSLTNFWILEDHYLFYDYNGAKMVRYDQNGSFISEYTVDIGELGGRVEHLYDDTVVLPADGENMALLKIIDLADAQSDAQFIGEALVNEDDGDGLDNREIVERGGIPTFMKTIYLSANESGIYAFHSTTALLQKFDSDGNLLWEKNLKIPSLENVYEEFLQRVKEQESFLPLYTYARDMHALDNGVAILFNAPEQKPVSIAWIPDNGHQLCVIEYTNIEKPANSNAPFRFQVASKEGIVLFANTWEGKVLRSIWPNNCESS